jgi:hypothetical protein
MKYITLLILLTSYYTGIAQSDSVRYVKYGHRVRFKTGIYLNHNQLVNNKPVSLNRIVSKYNKSGFDFFEKLLSEKKIVFYDDYGIKRYVNPDELWGFCRRGAVFINWGDNFNRISVIGKISHFIASITVYEDNYNSNFGNYFYGSPPTTTRTDIYQFIMDFDTGNVVEYSVENVSAFLMSDKELYKEYNELNKKNKKRMKFFYIRKFNERHPIYIPIN